MVNAQRGYKIIYVQEIKRITIPLSEVFATKGYRLDASVYCTAGRAARKRINNSPLNVERLNLSGSFLEECYYPGRFKRSYIDENLSNSYGFLGSAEMLDVRPHPVKFLLPDKGDLEILKVKYGDVLISRSGTIGNITFVSKTLTKYLISEHAIRIRCKQYPGYVYAFLKSKIGKSLITSNTYGAVVNQVEPEHLYQIPIVNPGKTIKEKIHNLIVTSFQLRDDSNELIDKAQQILIQELQLPSTNEIPQQTFGDDINITAYTIPASKLNSRLDGSYHVPIADAIIKHISKYATNVVQIGNKQISKAVVLPGRFKRIYVEKNNGIPFFGGKQIYELAPSNVKYLSKIYHSKRFKEQLELKENMILVTCSGTIGKVVIVPKHWKGWAANQHILRIVPANNDIAGYLYAWLDTDYGKTLIKKHTYGAVVDEIDDRQLSKVPIPLIEEGKQNQINNLVLEANRKRYKAYLLEQKAVSIINSQVLN